MAGSFDAVVIGGASALFRLTQLGCRRTLLLDRGAIGFEAEAAFADPCLVTTGFARPACRSGAVS